MRQARVVGGDGGDQRVHHLVLHHVGAVAAAGGARSSAATCRMISLSLASVLVISANSRRRSPNAAPIAVPGRLAHRCGRASDSLFSAALTVSSSPPNGMRMPAMVSSNSRLQAARPVTSFSCSSFSSSSDSWCGRNTRRSRSQGRQRASAGSASFCLQHRVVQPVQLQREEHQVAADRGHPLGHGLVEAADLRIGRIAAEQQLRVGHQPAEDLLDPLVFGDGRGQSGAGQRRQACRHAPSAKARAALSAAAKSASTAGASAAGYRSDRSQAGRSSAPSAGGADARAWANCRMSGIVLCCFHVQLM